MSAIEQLIALDEENDKQRQKELYRHGLSFDEGRPIYQQPVNLAHFADEDSPEVFEEMVTNIEGLHPDPEIVKLAAEFKQIQRDIDRRSNGYLKELEQEEVAKTIEKLKQEIERLNKQIEQKEESINQRRVSLQSLHSEVEQYETYVKTHSKTL